MADSKYQMNPYAVVGDVHTQGLDYMAGALSDSPTQEEVVSLATSFMAHYDFGITGDCTGSWRFPWIIIMGPYAVNASIDFGSFRKQAGFIPTQNSFIDQMLAAVDALSDDPYKAGESILDTITAIEKKVYGSDLALDRQLPVLAGTAVAKASFTYWEGVYNDRESAWLRIFGGNGNGDAPQGKIKWRDVFKADLIGAITGGVSGGLAGAGVGALAGSAIDIIKQS